MVVCFRAGRKKLYHRYVHRLVLELFVGECPNGMESRHLNGDPTDNRVENVAWATHQENIDDKQAHGTHLRGANAPLAKLTSREALIVRRLYDEDGISQDRLSYLFGLSQTCIGRIVRGEAYLDAAE